MVTAVDTAIERTLKMAKIHYFQRYSSPENTVTNNTLLLVARIYSYSPTQASNLLNQITGEQIEIGVEINQQGRTESSVPDGAIVQRSFKILIEAKVGSGIDVDQLARHARGFGNESTKILLLLTREKMDGLQESNIRKAIAARTDGMGIVFKNVSYEEICTAVGGLFKDYEFEIKALVDDYIEYCNDTGLSDQSKYLMRVVPCGQSVELNRKYAMYFHPSDRGYTKHSFVGVYEGKRVRFLFAIDSVYDVELKDGKLKKTLIQGRQTDQHDNNIVAMIGDAKRDCGYEIADGHRFFCGRDLFETNYIKRSSGGIMGARNFNLKEILGTFTDAKDIAEKLSGQEWD
jgi:hypothetical protein